MKVLAAMYRNMELTFSAMPNIIYLLSTVAATAWCKAINLLINH